MEEVRSYWQVANITHFCTLFQKPFKLPQFEPEELEQAFIIDVPACEKQEPQANIQLISNNNNKNLQNHNTDTSSEKDDDDNGSTSNSVDDSERAKPNQSDTYSSSSGYLSSVDTNNRFQPPRNTSSYSSSLNYQSLGNSIQTQPQPQQKVEEDQQQDLHLLVRLAIALLKPHFNSKITPTNWENYLKRIIEANWIELENCPSPFSVIYLSTEGEELSKNLNFNDLSLSDKIEIFYALCDYRFWCDDASDAIKDYPIEELRLESIGKDQQCYEYWYFSGTRLFREDKELALDLTNREKRIKELEYKLIELEKNRLHHEREEKKRLELEQAKKLAEEARLAAKRQQEKEEEEAFASASNDNTESSGKKRKRNINNHNLPLRTGLRERRSSAASNNHEQTKSQTPARTTRASLAKQNNTPEQKQPTQQSQKKSTGQKRARGSKTNSKDYASESQNGKASPEQTKEPTESECREELEKLRIKPEDRKASWTIQCESLEDWENFVVRFEKTKSTYERHLYANLNEVILPAIRAIYAKRAAEARRKEKEMLLSLATRRVSTRIITKKAQEEEEERQAQIREIEMQKKKAEAEMRLKAELEREMRAKRNRFVINGEIDNSEEVEMENPSRYNLRQQHDLFDDPSHEFDGIIHPDKLSDFYEALELIIDTVRTSKHAWPFVDPVPETVPGYYDLIQEPMDLKKLRTKVEFREYRSLIEVEKDFQLLVNNCERFNGPKNIYTKMVYKLWKSFRKNVQLYLQRNLHMNEHETFVYPPPPPAPIPPPSPQPQNEQLDIEPTKFVHSQTELSPKANEIETRPLELTQVAQLKPVQVEPVVEITQPKHEPLEIHQNNFVSLGDTTTNSKLIEPSETNLAQPMEVSTCPETIVEEIIYDVPENETYIWQDTVNEDQ